MAGRGSSVAFFVVLLAVVGAVGWLLLRPAPLPETTPGPAGPGPSAGGAPPDVKKPAPPPDEPPEPGIEATPEACLAFLRTHASEPRPAKGRVTYVYPEIRMAALDALSSTEGVDADPELRRALGGDGDAEDWFESRLFAAGILIRRGDPAGAETLRDYLKTPMAEEDADVAAVAAGAASRLPAEEAGNALRLLLVKMDAYESESLAEVLQAVASVGRGSNPQELQGILADEEWDGDAFGAAAGALLRLGNEAGAKAAEAYLGEDAEFEQEEFAWGLGARGNATVLPLLKRFLVEGDAWTRIAAAASMMRVGDASAVPALREALKDEDEDVRQMAAVALASFGEKGTLDLVRAAAAGSSDYEVSAAAFRVLGDLRDAASRPVAAKLLAEPLPPRRHPDRLPGIIRRLWAARVIILLGP